MSPSLQVTPYLFFEGRAEEALDFYGTALGAKVTMLMRYKENPTPQSTDGCAGGPGPGPAPDMVMHAAFTIGDTELYASDGMGSGKPEFKGISLSLGPADEAQARRIFDALSAGGQVQVPLGPTFFSPAFGMVVDRFGVGWMVVVPQ